MTSSANRRILDQITSPDQASEIINALLSRYDITFTASVAGRLPSTITLMSKDMDSIDVEVIHELTQHIRTLWDTPHRSVAEFISGHQQKVVMAVLERHPNRQNASCVTGALVKELCNGDWFATVDFDGSDGRFTVKSPAKVCSNVADAQEWVEEAIYQHGERARGYSVYSEGMDGDKEIEFSYRVS